ncbi:MAG: biopolymer transport protein ExbD [Flavobacteriales bacterium]|jgi:biopolymer transport protein ExbD
MARRRRRGMEATVELNITAFMNLMVILVPFLLITAVFSRMTVLELNLPALDAAEKNNQEITLDLQVLVTQENFVIRDANLGTLKTIARTVDGVAISEPDRKIWKPFASILLEVKRRFPEETGISLLLDKKVSYESMIAIMDRVRSTDIVLATTLETIELFPDVSIGDYPVETVGSKPSNEDE